MKRRLIESKRSQMLRLAKKYGFTSAQTVRCSQELDELLNEIQIPIIRNKI
ncbi:aspartyl-phosphate phosphatase Spo0E family protein [Alkalihalobacillus pseudalcaliphilus]|uniref:aspartyl-phosphate phosphatase Spo0E family protein n=1 Tax=Alkalihalobacillus pseudalcaliphilus TaxID=79884 RepID=UPI000A04CF28|nr:aspartyl-phosphate phosphatase Spo0E family protein [Alkalihalobacillus pseudalcaliphilus]